MSLRIGLWKDFVPNLKQIFVFSFEKLYERYGEYDCRWRPKFLSLWKIYLLKMSDTCLKSEYIDFNFSICM